MRSVTRFSVVVTAAVTLAAGSLALAPAAQAWSASSTACAPPGSAAIVKLDLSPSQPYPVVRTHRGDVIKVTASMKDQVLTVPRAVRHVRAVCQISGHRRPDGSSVAWFRARHDNRRVTFDADTVPGCGNCLSLILAGRARIRGESTFVCDRPADATVDRLPLSDRLPTPRVRAHRGDVIRVSASFGQNTMASPRPSLGWQVVCRIGSWHETDGSAIATFRALRIRRKVMFYSGVSGCGGPQMCPGFSGRVRIRP